jgi:hypothetical protein
MIEQLMIGYFIGTLLAIVACAIYVIWYFIHE